MRRKSFTLIELLVVIAIIAVLVGSVLPAVSLGNDKANRAHCRANLERIGLALKLFVEDYGRFPPSLRTLVEKGYLDDPSTLVCPKTGRPYVYHQPKGLGNPEEIVASCVPLDTPKGRRPHGFGEVVIVLRANGRVDEIGR